MKKSGFLLQLERGLKPLPKEERESAMQYYREYWEDNAGRNEEEISSELGDPQHIARQIVNDYAASNPGYPVKQKMSTGTKVLIVVLLVLSSPIWVPLLLALCGVALGLAVAALAVVCSLFVVAIAFAVGGVVTVVAAIVVARVHLPTMFYGIGMGLCMTGIGILMWMGLIALINLIAKNRRAKRVAESERPAARPTNTASGWQVRGNAQTSSGQPAQPATAQQPAPEPSVGQIATEVDEPIR